MPASDIQNTPSRNAPCPCGSGKKYKRCCGQQAGARPGNAGPARPDQLQRVIHYYQQGNLQLAGETAASLLKTNPDDTGLIEISAAVAAQTGRTELAVEQFTHLVQLQPGNALAHSNLCMLLHSLNRDEEAFMHGQQAIQLDPQLADAWNNLGNVYKSGNHLDGAQQHYEKALEIDPDDPEILVNAGVVNQLLGDLGTAEQRYRHATQVAPEFAGAYNNLGAVLQKQERYDEAGHAFNTALGLQPTNPEILTNLGALMLEQGNTEKAGEFLQQAIDQNPAYAGAWASLGNLYDSLNESDLATQNWNKALQLDPDNSTVLCNIGFRLFELGHQKEATGHFVRALKSNPNSVKALAGLGTAMLRQDEIENATKYIENALQLAPWDIHAHMAHASLLEARHQPEEACDEWRYVTSHKPDLPDGYIGLAKHFTSQEDYAAARQQYQLAESRIPDSFKLYNAWSQMEESVHDLQMAATLARKAAVLNPGYPGLAIMQAKLARRNKDYAGALEQLEKISIDIVDDKHIAASYLFELGAVQDKLGHYSKAFSAYRAANETKNLYAGRYYNHDSDRENNEKIKQLYNSETIRKLSLVTEELDTPTPQPVFIVGFPRSGTSLLEQILGSHKEISPAGELTGINDIAISRIKQLTGSKLDYPDFINDPDAPLDNGKIELLRNDYLALANRRCVKKENIAWITDKMPHNAVHIGLIRILFPHAPVIHIARNPLNPCLSAYFSNFKTSHRYTSDLKSTALHYEQVMGLVEHYREIGIDFLEIKYEDLVNNQEAVTRKVLEYIGAPWDDAVLQHHKSTRVVKTASYEQVTQKVYTSSLNRYQNYWDAVQEIIPILQPTIDRLGYTVEPPPIS